MCRGNLVNDLNSKALNQTHLYVFEKNNRTLLKAEMYLKSRLSELNSIKLIEIEPIFRNKINTRIYKSDYSTVLIKRIQHII